MQDAQGPAPERLPGSRLAMLDGETRNEESVMLTRRLMASLAVCGLVGLAACAGDDVDDDAVITEDTIMQRDIEEIEVPVEVTDTAVVRTEIDVDTAIDVDTIDGGM
jgi:hypothetical protein